jgi:hypothetical membrane protein
LLTGGVIGPVLFVVDFLAEGATRPGYDVVRHSVSQLSLSNLGWQQVANFLVSGVLIIGGALGLRRAIRQRPGSRWGPILVGLAGAGLVLAGVFVTDPALGYPPGQPASSSWHGAIHEVVSLLVFVGLPAAMFVLARRFRGEGSRWATYSWLSGIGTVVFLFSAFAFEDVTGLLQRVSIVIAFGWVARLGWRYRGEAARS